MFLKKIALRNLFCIKIVCFDILGNPGHGSRFIENTAAEKVQYLINKLLGYREEQKKKFEADPNSTLGDVTTVNLTTMSGGVQQNVVPNEFVIGFDIRITPTTNLKDFEAMIRKWCDEVISLNLITVPQYNYNCRFSLEIRVHDGKIVFGCSIILDIFIEH